MSSSDKPKNMGASVFARLKNEARKQNEFLTLCFSAIVSSDFFID